MPAPSRLSVLATISNSMAIPWTLGPVISGTLRSGVGQSTAITGPIVSKPSSTPTSSPLSGTLPCNLATKIGVGVGVPLGIIILVTGGFAFHLWRRIHSKRATLQQDDPVADLKPELPASASAAGGPLRSHDSETRTGIEPAELGAHEGIELAEPGEHEGIEPAELGAHDSQAQDVSHYARDGNEDLMHLDPHS